VIVVELEFVAVAARIVVLVPSIELDISNSNTSSRTTHAFETDRWCNHVLLLGGGGGEGGTVTAV